MVSFNMRLHGKKQMALISLSVKMVSLGLRGKKKKA